MAHIFGAGEMFAVPLTDSTGATVSNPTPVKLLDLQSAKFEVSGESKSLHGQYQLPVASARGKASISLNIKMARVFARAWNTLFFGQTLTAGLIGIRSDVTGATIPGTPYTITPTVPNSGTWASDLGVLDSNGVPMQRVASAPAAGQYSVAAGVYTFASADTTKTVYISFRYTATVAGAQKLAIYNELMGYAPTMRIEMMASYKGKMETLIIHDCTAPKLSIELKNEDFSVPEFELIANAPAAGPAYELSFTE